MFLKPPIAIFDLLTAIIEGLKNSTVYEVHIMEERSRPPRIFGPNKILIPFNFTLAYGKDIIRKYKLK